MGAASKMAKANLSRHPARLYLVPSPPTSASGGFASMKPTTVSKCHGKGTARLIG